VGGKGSPEIRTLSDDLSEEEEVFLPFPPLPGEEENGGRVTILFAPTRCNKSVVSGTNA